MAIYSQQDTCIPLVQSAYYILLNVPAHVHSISKGSAIDNTPRPPPFLFFGLRSVYYMEAEER